MPRPTVLLVDDDVSRSGVLASTLRRAGFTPVVAHDAATALAALRDEQPAGVVLDVHLGVGAQDGSTFLRRLRERSSAPVILITGVDAEAATCLGLDLGADDYLVQPISRRDVLFRLRVQLRRHSPPVVAPPGTAALRVGLLTIDPLAHEATLCGRPLALGPTAFDLLYCLAAHAGGVVSTRELMQQVWGVDDVAGKDAVRVAVRRLRRTLDGGGTSATPSLLETVPGVGFRLKTNPPAPRLVVVR